MTGGLHGINKKRRHAQQCLRVKRRAFKARTHFQPSLVNATCSKQQKKQLKALIRTARHMDELGTTASVSSLQVKKMMAAQARKNKHSEKDEEEEEEEDDDDMSLNTAEDAGGSSLSAAEETEEMMASSDSLRREEEEEEGRATDGTLLGRPMYFIQH